MVIFQNEIDIGMNIKLVNFKVDIFYLVGTNLIFSL